jgi:hypothetical protein
LLQYSSSSSKCVPKLPLHCILCHTIPTHTCNCHLKQNAVSRITGSIKTCLKALASAVLCNKKEHINAAGPSLLLHCTIPHCIAHVLYSKRQQTIQSNSATSGKAYPCSANQCVSQLPAPRHMVPHHTVQDSCCHFAVSKNITQKQRTGTVSHGRGLTCAASRNSSICSLPQLRV